MDTPYFTYDGGSDPSSLKIYKMDRIFSEFEYTSNGGFSGMTLSNDEPFGGSKIMNDGTPHLPFIGELDEGQIWNYVISGKFSPMNTPLVGDEDGLVGYWNFNDGEGSTLTDLVGMGMMVLSMVLLGVIVLSYPTTIS